MIHESVLYSVVNLIMAREPIMSLMSIDQAASKKGDWSRAMVCLPCFSTANARIVFIIRRC